MSEPIEIFCAFCHQRWDRDAGMTVFEQHARETGHMTFATDWDIESKEMRLFVEEPDL